MTWKTLAAIFSRNTERIAGVSMIYSSLLVDCMYAAFVGRRGKQVFKSSKVGIRQEEKGWSIVSLQSLSKLLVVSAITIKASACVSAINI